MVVISILKLETQALWQLVGASSSLLERVQLPLADRYRLAPILVGQHMVVAMFPFFLEILLKKVDAYHSWSELQCLGTEDRYPCLVEMQLVLAVRLKCKLANHLCCKGAL